MTYENLLQIAEKENIEVYEMNLPEKLKGIYGDNCIGISRNIDTTTEKACVLAEELGHHYTTSGNILDISDIKNRKQELQARAWAYNRQIGLVGVIKAYENRCKDKSEMADYLNVTEEFLEEAIKFYKQKYGISVKIGNYIIQFEPNLYVMKLL